MTKAPLMGAPDRRFGGILFFKMLFHGLLGGFSSVIMVKSSVYLFETLLVYYHELLNLHRFMCDDMCLRGQHKKSCTNGVSGWRHRLTDRVRATNLSHSTSLHNLFITYSWTPLWFLLFYQTLRKPNNVKLNENCHETSWCSLVTFGKSQCHTIPVLISLHKRVCTKWCCFMTDSSIISQIHCEALLHVHAVERVCSL